MRSVFLAAVLLPAAASVAQSQQAHPLNVANEVTTYSQQSSVAHPTPAPSLRLVDAPIGITRAQALSNGVGSNNATSGAATVDNNTRNTLAIVGAVVIVLALLAFLL